ncbi:hypothetical protein ACFYWU_34430 [Streptomyces chrestomyceticus]|uniref:hypothetical protein n=1 Tax=Streptomyces chrestomyceticus TaxID=68185 RepID=UPI00369CF761
MPSAQISRRAHTYVRYTGAPRQLASNVVAALAPGAPLIPAPAEHEQLLFESEVLYHVLSTQRDFFEYPFGIQYVEPTADDVRLHVESARSLDLLLSGLLPCYMPVGPGERGELYGLCGVRICARTERGIELRRLGRPGSLKLTGPSRRCFAQAEARLLERVEDNGGQACWRTEGRWTDQERRWDADRQPLVYEPIWRDAAWLPSGLLRRLGLLHTVAVPQLVTGHENRLGEWWILELDHFADTGLRRAELVQALTDADHGLPLQLRGYRDCKPGESLGLVLLQDQAETATLQLRYDRFDYPAKGRTDRTEMFAAIRQRISKVTGEAQLPPMPDGRATG